MDYLPAVIAIAKQAGEILLSYFYNGFSHAVTLKSDQSPVTAADTKASDFIIAELKKITPELPVLSEESDIPDFSERQTWSRYWLVDPLDGTRGFINRSPEFCVNIALIEHNRPILGVIYTPVEKQLSYAAAGRGAWCLSDEAALPVRLSTTKADLKHLRVLCGHSHKNAQLRQLLLSFFDEVTLTALNSAIKFPRIAAGIADLYLRLHPTSEWDTAAGQCIVEEAGGAVVDFQGEPLQYNTKISLLNPSFMAIGDRLQIGRYLAVGPSEPRA